MLQDVVKAETGSFRKGLDQFMEDRSVGRYSIGQAGLCPLTALDQGCRCHDRHAPFLSLSSDSSAACHYQRLDTGLEGLHAGDTGFSNNAGLCTAICPLDAEDFLEAWLVVLLPALERMIAGLPR